MTSTCITFISSSICFSGDQTCAQKKAKKGPDWDLIAALFSSDFSPASTCRTEIRAIKGRNQVAIRCLFCSCAQFWSLAGADSQSYSLMLIDS